LCRLLRALRVPGGLLRLELRVLILDLLASLLFRDRVIVAGRRVIGCSLGRVVSRGLLRSRYGVEVPGETLSHLQLLGCHLLLPGFLLLFPFLLNSLSLLLTSRLQLILLLSTGLFLSSLGLPLLLYRLLARLFLDLLLLGGKILQLSLLACLLILILFKISLRVFQCDSKRGGSSRVTLLFALLNLSLDFRYLTIGCGNRLICAGDFCRYRLPLGTGVSASDGTVGVAIDPFSRGRPLRRSAASIGLIGIAVDPSDRGDPLRPEPNRLDA
jgi:hypothetical protein